MDISLSKNLKFVLPLVLTPRYIPLQKTLELLKNFITTKNYGDKKLLSAMQENIKYIKNKIN